MIDAYELQQIKERISILEANVEVLLRDNTIMWFEKMKEIGAIRDLGNGLVQVNEEWLDQTRSVEGHKETS